ncbi:MAG: toxic anion resistance protein [Alphaproteobacteria bacterium]|nr:toxic anion resistance protein [Alphaproteobacteria bacterium]
MTDSTGSPAQTATRSPLDLRLDVAEVKGALALRDPEAIGKDADVDAELDAKAGELVASLLDFGKGDVDAEDRAKEAVETMGRALQQAAAHKSAMLRAPIKDLSRHAEDGGPVANALVDLKLQVEELDPNKFDFEAGWFSRLLGMLPGIGTPLKRYFTKYESSQTVIDAIIRSLDMGKDQLNRDNVTLGEDQKAMRTLTRTLERQIELAQLMDSKIQYKLDREIAADDPRRGFVQDEILFPLRQRIMDLQQQLAVNQQGVLSTAIIIGNNKELIRGVDRALDVTVSALQVAVTVALALAHQKIVLDKVEAINKTTSDLIAGTAAQLKRQGAAIHTRASSAGLDMESLKSAFADINAAMEEISSYRREALPQMAQTILEFDKLAEEGEEAIKKMEQGRAARPTLDLDEPF